MATTVRVNDELHATLRELSSQEARSIGDVIADAIDQYQKARFWDGVRAEYERLRADPDVWAEYQAEMALWDSLSGDGLSAEPPYYPPDEEAELDAESA